MINFNDRINMRGKHMKNNSVLGDLSELIQSYSQLEELAAKLLKINIDQLENRISNTIPMYVHYTCKCEINYTSLVFYGVYS